MTDNPNVIIGDPTDLAQLAFDKYVGMSLAMASSILIGTSFIVTKLGLQATARAGGTRSNGEGHEYLKNPLWWAGTLCMVLGEITNFGAYSFAPAILVTPLGAGSVFVGAILSAVFLKEYLGRDGMIGCLLCVLGSVLVVLHSPEEQEIADVDQVFALATRPGFLIYMLLVIGISLYLIYVAGPKYGKTHLLVYVTICSLIGSISVMAVKGFAVAIRLTFAGQNQLFSASTWVFMLTIVICAATQINYFNKALDLFSTNRVTPVYYVFFTTATIVASVILFEGFNSATWVQVFTVVVGFITIFVGVFMINSLDRPMMRRSSSLTSPRESLVIQLNNLSRTAPKSFADEHLLKTFEEAIPYDDEDEESSMV